MLPTSPLQRPTGAVASSAVASSANVSSANALSANTLTANTGGCGATLVAEPIELEEAVAASEKHDGGEKDTSARQARLVPRKPKGERFQPVGSSSPLRAHHVHVVAHLCLQLVDAVFALLSQEKMVTTSPQSAATAGSTSAYGLRLGGGLLTAVATIAGAATAGAVTTTHWSDR